MTQPGSRSEPSTNLELRMPRSTRVAFSLLPVIVLVLLLVGGEVALRKFAPDPGRDLVRAVEYDGIAWWELNQGFLRKYFPPDAPAIPEFRTQLFRREKTAQTFRVFCLGESSMYGTPYDMSANIPAIVRKHLRRMAPGKEVEVINLGASAVSSNVIRHFAPDVTALEPDLILVYTGHNEFYGPEGVGAGWLDRTIPDFPQLRYTLRELRLVQVAMSLLGGRVPPASAPNLMRQVSQGSLVRLDSPESVRIAAQFERNLGEIIATFRERNVPVVVSEVVSNLTFPPFVSDSTLDAIPGLVSASALEDLVLRGEADSAITLIGAAPEPATKGAAWSYWAGRAYMARGRLEEARRHLVLARDNDLLKFRAPSFINEIIRSVCRRSAVVSVPAESLLTMAAGGGIPGDTLFWEHLHPTAFGYYQLAGFFVDAVAQGEYLAPSRSTRIPFHTDSLSICWLDLAYADLGVQNLTGQWPFVNYRRTPVVLGTADPGLRQILTDTYNRTLRWNEGCYRSAAYLWGRGRFREAQTTYEALLEEYPYSFYTNYLLGSLLNSTGSPDRAVPYYERSITSNPRYVKPRLDLGLVDVNRGRLDDAIAQLTTVLSMLGVEGGDDDRVVALYGLGAAYANRGELPKALKFLDQALALRPAYGDALRLRAAVVAAAGGRLP